MAFRAVCGLLGVVGRRSGPNGPSHLPCRSFHTGIMQPRQSQPLAEWFSEVFSTRSGHAPDSIYKMMDVIHADAPHKVTPFNLLCRTSMDRWAIKGLRIGAKGAHGRTVVIVSGAQASERMPISVSLYVAAALSRQPVKGVEVTVFPVMRPREYELQWRNEQVFQQVSQFTEPAVGGSFPLLQERDNGVEGPLRSYVTKRNMSYVDMEMTLDASRSHLRLRSNSVQRQLRRADILLANVPKPSAPTDMPNVFTPTDTPLFNIVAGPPAVVLELRDRRKVLSEEEISVCGEEVLATIQKLVAESSGSCGVVL